MGEEERRHRLVALGAGAVGKTSILNRFLNGKFSHNYRPTVDDLHCRDYNVHGSCIMVDFLDTAGDHSFPAMRRLSISTAHAFILVYSVDRPDSFDEIRHLYEQIKEVRSNYQDIPCVVVGNKCDLPRQVGADDVLLWAHHNGISESAILDTSAKDDSGIVDIFQKLLIQANVPQVKQLEPILSRRLSAKEGRTNRETVDMKLKDPDSKLGRSRSLIRRTTRPKMKQAQDINKNDCVLM